MRAYTELENAISKFRTTVPISVAGLKIHVPGSVDYRGSPTLPDSTLASIWGRAEYSYLAERRSVVPHNPPVIWAIILMRTPANHDNAVG